MLKSLIPLKIRNDDAFMSMQREMNRMFDDAFRGYPTVFADRKAAALTPRMDVKETDKSLEITAELPGVEQKDVEVNFADGVVTIKGEKKAEKDETKGDYHVSERSYGSFYRSLAVDDVDADKIVATFDKGVLKVTLPKAPAAQRNAKKIEIKTAK